MDIVGKLVITHVHMTRNTQGVGTNTWIHAMYPPTYLLVNSELTVEWFSHHTVQTTPPACKEVQYTSRAVNETLMGP